MRDEQEHVDTIVVGSGFGGSVVAYRLAAAGEQVTLLERGRAYAPGSFPRLPQEMKANFWDPSRGLHGLFNVWSFRHIGAIVASGLGGGSLIYANVLLRKDANWFVGDDSGSSGRPPWPITREDLDPHYDAVEQMLAPQLYPTTVAPYDATPKTRAMTHAGDALEAAFPGEVRRIPTPLAVRFRDATGAPCVGAPIVEPQPNLHGCARVTCKLCGECNFGCNHGSKNTLDLTYLSRAHDLGARLCVEMEVRAVRPRGPGGRDGYEVDYVDHREQADGSRGCTVKTMSCRRLVLAAGALGSTYLLLRSRDAFPDLSPRLGHAFNGNGDLLGLAVRSRCKIRDDTPPLDPSLGPVITTALRVADELDGGTARGRGFYVEDAGYPRMLDWLMQASGLPGRVRRHIRARRRKYTAPDPTCDLGAELSELISDRAGRHWLPLLGMGRDVASGRAFLEGGWLQLDWTVDASAAYFERVRKMMSAIADALDADLSDDPLAYLGRSITVHPLGGCPMGHNSDEGVVDSFGKVFGYTEFYIVDGSIMPGAVGPNPAFTIAACADRSASRMLAGAKTPP